MQNCTNGETLVSIIRLEDFSSRENKKVNLDFTDKIKLTLIKWVKIKPSSPALPTHQTARK